MAEEKRDQQPEAKFEVINLTEKIREEDFVRFYANNIQVAFSQWDMRMTFGETIENKDGKLLVKERATITMSLQHAKAVISILSANFAELEKRFGEIKILQPFSS